MQHADADAKTQTPITVCACVFVFLCVTRLNRRPACPPVAQQLSICQSVNLSVCQSQHSLITIPAGLGDHKITEELELQA